jgi:hypothetical protein
MLFSQGLFNLFIRSHSPCRNPPFFIFAALFPWCSRKRRRKTNCISIGGLRRGMRRGRGSSRGISRKRDSISVRGSRRERGERSWKRCLAGKAEPRGEGGAETEGDVDKDAVSKGEGVARGKGEDESGEAQTAALMEEGGG